MNRFPCSVAADGVHDAPGGATEPPVGACRRRIPTEPCATAPPSASADGGAEAAWRIARLGDAGGGGGAGLRAWQTAPKARTAPARVRRLVARLFFGLGGGRRRRPTAEAEEGVQRRPSHGCE